MASFPQRQFSLTEIARATEVNRASCHALLLELEQRGYLSRHATLKTYWLGPALVATGHSAMLANPVLGRTRDEAERLRGALGLPVLLSTVIAQEIVCVLSLHDEAGRNAGLRVGDRVPLLPPIGMSFVAWSPPEEADAWIARRVDAGGAVAGRLRETLAVVRERGFHVTLRRPDTADIASVLARAASSKPAPSSPHRQLAAFVETLDVEAAQPDIADAAAAYDVHLIAAPVVDPATRVTYNLCLGGFSSPLSGTTVAALGSQLTEACLTVMKSLD